MTAFITRQVEIKATEQQNGEGILISRGGRPTSISGLDALNEAELKKYVLAAPTVDKDLLEGSLVAIGRILYIETDQDITVKLADTTDTGIEVKPLNSSTPGVLYLEGSFSKVYVSLAGTTDANILMGVVGA